MYGLESLREASRITDIGMRKLNKVMALFEELKAGRSSQGKSSKCDLTYTDLLDNAWDHCKTPALNTDGTSDEPDLWLQSPAKSKGNSSLLD